MNPQTFRGFRNPAGELEIHPHRPAPVADLHAARRTRTTLPPAAGAIVAAPVPEVPEWAMLRPPATTDAARTFGRWVLPVRAVLIGLLWATSSPARAGVTAAALVLLYALI